MMTSCNRCERRK